MMLVLADDMSDPSRLRRGKQYAKDGTVLDIIVEPGLVTSEIQGSRTKPYIATVEVTAGDAIQLRRDIATSCTCPDDDNWDGYACKHVVAAMFVLSDEFLLEPELLDVWRDRTVPAPDDLASESDEDDPNPPSPERTGRHLRLVRPDESHRAPRTVPRPPDDPLAVLLRIPEGTALAELPDIDRIEPDLPRSRELATVLRDAIGHLRIEWD